MLLLLALICIGAGLLLHYIYTDYITYVRRRVPNPDRAAQRDAERKSLAAQRSVLGPQPPRKELRSSELVHPEPPTVSEPATAASPPTLTLLDQGLVQLEALLDATRQPNGCDDYCKFAEDFRELRLRYGLNVKHLKLLSSRRLSREEQKEFQSQFLSCVGYWRAMYCMGVW